MGITGLLQGLKTTSGNSPCYTSSTNIREFAGQSIAVDASSWLHKSVYSIADHFVECVESGNPSESRCVEVSAGYMIQRCQELLQYARVSQIVLVMDGRRCPLKAVTHQQREQRRTEALKQARAWRRQGQHEKMYEKYKTCIRVPAELGNAVAHRIQRHFTAKTPSHTPMAVSILWAPYEADAQLIKLAKDGMVQAIITEDSDVLLYAATAGVTVPILFKLDRGTGSCDVTNMKWLLCPSPPGNDTGENAPTHAKSKRATGLDSFLQAFAMRERRTPGLGVRLLVQASVLSGCDYAPNQLDKVGTVTAFKLIRNAIHRDDRFAYVLKNIPHKCANPTEYELLLRKSEAVFYYHPVRDSHSKQVVYLNDPHAVNPQQPSLVDLDNDWSSFLGSISPDLPSIKLPISSETTPKPNSRKQEILLPNHGISAKRPTNASKPLTNPYSRPCRKRSLDHVVEACEVNRKENSILPDGKENSRQPNLFEFYCNRTEDVRFVKRTFPANGTRMPLTKPIHQNALECESDSTNVPDKDQKSKALFVTTNPMVQVPMYNVNEECGSGPKPTNSVESAISPYFAKEFRRITLDSQPPTDGKDDRLSQCSEATSVSSDGLVPSPNSEIPAVGCIGWKQSSLLPVTKFDMYDDFISPHKQHDKADTSEEDDIITVHSSPECQTCLGQLTPIREPSYTLGPARNIRFRFGVPSTATTTTTRGKSKNLSLKTTVLAPSKPLSSSLPRRNGNQTTLDHHFFHKFSSQELR